MSEIRTLDLAEYGQSGIVEMSIPSLRKRVMRDNALGNCTDTKYVKGETIITDSRVGDAAVIRILAYVRRAPFPTDLKGFLDFCDRMDENDLGSAERLYSDMEKIVSEIGQGETPLPDSQEVVIQSSD